MKKQPTYTWTLPEDPINKILNFVTNGFNVRTVVTDQILIKEEDFLSFNVYNELAAIATKAIRSDQVLKFESPQFFKKDFTQGVFDNEVNRVIALLRDIK